MKHLIVFEVEHRAVYTQFLDCLYDYLMDVNTTETVAAAYLDYFLSKDGMRKLFKDGFTMMALSSEMFAKVERLNSKNQPFAVRIVKNGETFAWIMSDDCSY